MKARDSSLRLKRFAATEKARKVEDLSAMLREFETMVLDLDRQIQTEEDRTGVRDVAHFAYSTFAKAAAQRRDNLRASILDLKAQLEVARQVHSEAADELARAEAAEPREADRGGRGKSERTSLPA
jgi:hypothetical protein